VPGRGPFRRWVCQGRDGANESTRRDSNGVEGGADVVMGQENTVRIGDTARVANVGVSWLTSTTGSCWKKRRSLLSLWLVVGSWTRSREGEGRWRGESEGPRRQLLEQVRYRTAKGQNEMFEDWRAIKL
jgi:hypothetical protein